ncbi:MAG: glycosyl hydrolase, partial [Candidatus Sumerlaeota bacterium]|nr:glycosyl hydrolase [Candidatus Sumerlaeota bacterium]
MIGLARLLATMAFLAAALAGGAHPAFTARNDAPTADDLARTFVQPPDSAKPHTWWHWMNGNITREGITKDLQEMKRVGLGGAEIFNVTDGIEPGPVKFMSPEWRALVKHAIEEADRQGLEICVHNCAGWSSSGGPWVQPAHAMQMVVWSETSVAGPKRFSDVLPQPQTNNDFYRDIEVLAFPTPPVEGRKMADFSPTITASDPKCQAKNLIDGKADTTASLPKPKGKDAPWIQLEFSEPFEARAVSVLTGRGKGAQGGEIEVSDDGKEFRKAGEFTIPGAGSNASRGSSNFAPVTARFFRLRFAKADAKSARMNLAEIELLNGFRLSGIGGKAAYVRQEDPKPETAPAPPEAVVARDTLVEVGSQNWTPKFREEFQKRKGYDPSPWLPVMTGRVVDNVESSERFLWDLRRVIADLFAENYYGYFAELCHQRGMTLSDEPYGSGLFDVLACGGKADIPMSEFWAGKPGDNTRSKYAASAAHTYGKKFVGAESFTAAAEQGKWQNYPYNMKALGDLMYTGGVNRFIFHRYAHQPWLDRKPGMTMGPHGFHFEWTLTWWDQAPAWLQYLTRCQYLLQAGQFVGDLAYFVGEGSPNAVPARDKLAPPPPAGYDYDGVNAEVILTRMAVKDGRIVLPDGMSYRVLVLP